jgi:hypothetical protein
VTVSNFRKEDNIGSKIGGKPQTNLPPILLSFGLKSKPITNVASTKCSIATILRCQCTL